MTPPQISALFVHHAADILGDTEKGMTGAEIAKVMRAYSLDLGVTIPYPVYPYDAPNKRTALAENLLAFKPADQYRIIVELCDRDSVVQKNDAEVKTLKLQTMAKYGHLAPLSLGDQVNMELIRQTQHWLGAFPDVLDLYNQALQKYESHVFSRNLLDDLRLALEALLKELLRNAKSLENQFSDLGVFVKSHGGSPELSNMFVKLVEYYSKYQNTYVKHNSAVIEDEIEFVLEISSAFMKHLVRLAGGGAV